MADATRRTILFLGTGNHGRSRVAETVFNSVASKMGLTWAAFSRGLAAKRPTKKEGAMAASAVKALQARGFRAGDFARDPAQVTEADFAAADRIIALDRAEQEPLVKDGFPAWADKIEYWQVGSGGDPLPAIELAVTDLVAGLFGGRPAAEAQAEPEPVRTKKPATVRIGRETKGRKGKGVTIVSDLPLNDAALHELAALMKGRCGTGGTVKDGKIEIQGDQRDRLTAEMEKLGYFVKRVGG